MGQGILGFDEHVRALFSGLLIGNIYFVDGEYGDDNSNGLDWGHALRTLNTANTRTTSHKHDYILCANDITQSAQIAWNRTRVHVIGASFRDMGAWGGRGCKVTTAYLGANHATLAASDGAEGMEFAGLHFYTSSASTSEIQVDDLGSSDVYIHDCTFSHAGEAATPPICLDIETADWTIRRCAFINVEKAIDSAARIFIFENYFFTAGTSAKAINLTNTVADNSLIVGNICNLGGGTTDVAITLAANVIGCTVHGNWVSNECSDPIAITTDTDQMVSGNFVDTLVSANTSTLKGWQGVQT